MRPETALDLLQHEQLRAYAYLQLLVGFVRTGVTPFILSTLFVLLSILLSQQYEILARPSPRGAHSTPTPRLGGLGVAISYYLSVVIAHGWMEVPPSAWVAALLIGGAWAVVGGALDDVYELPPRWKLLVQLAAGFAPFFLGFGLSAVEFPLFGTLALGGLASAAVTFLFVMLLMNVVNFMDGMDGHAASFGVLTSLVLALYMLNYGPFSRVPDYCLTLMLGSTTLGLLFWNFPGRASESKTFMGDSGSQFIGFSLAILSLRASEGASEGRFPLIASLVLFSPFIYDVSYTLLRRYRRGAVLTQPHKEHLYQRLMVIGWSHGRTLGFNLLLWLIAAALAVIYARAAEQGAGLVQLLILVLNGLLLWAYTHLVIRYERQEAARQASIAKTDAL